MMSHLLEGGRVALFFQPQIRLADGCVIGVEALLRWSHPIRGLLGPTALLARAESLGAMPALTHEVLDAALQQQTAWVAEGHPIRVSVNVPPDVFAGSHFPEMVHDTLQRHGVPGELLRIEVTEQASTVAWSELEMAASALRARGVSSSLDDFGTGEANLHRLAVLNFSELKLDLHLVQGITAAPRYEACVASAIELAHRLGMMVVAEGVEDAQTLKVLERLGCDVAQGFLFASPGPAHEVQLDPFELPSQPIAPAAQPATNAHSSSLARRRVFRVAAPRQDLRLPMALSGGYLIVYALWHLLRRPSWGHQPLVGDLSFIPLNAWAAAAAWRAGTRTAAFPRLRRGWRLMSLGLASYLLADMIQTWYEVALKVKPYPGPADIAYLSFYPLMMSGLLMLSSGRLQRHERATLVLDVATATIGASAVVWYFVLGPAAVAGGNSLTVATGIAYPVGDIVLVLAGVLALLRSPSASSRNALQILLGCLALFVVTDLVYGWLLLHGGYTGGDLVDLGWMVALAGIPIAASAQPRPTVQAERRGRPRMTSAGGLTLPAVLASGALLLAGGADENMYPLGGLIVAAVALTGLVSLRQSAALRAHARLAVEYRGLASTDVLTGLRSRRALLEEAEDLFAVARQRDLPLTLLMIDVDHFKYVNDTLGHAAGDLVLARVAGECRSALPDALIGRYGGDELVAVLPSSESDEAHERAGFLGRAISERSSFWCPDGPAVTVSIGVASAGGRRDLDALLAAADLALYEAKHAGRNCARTAALSPVPIG